MVAKKIVEKELKCRCLENIEINDGADGALNSNGATEGNINPNLSLLEQSTEIEDMEDQLEVCSDVAQDSDCQGDIRGLQPPSPSSDSSDMSSDEYQDVLSKSSEAQIIDSTYGDYDISDMMVHMIFWTLIVHIVTVMLQKKTMLSDLPAVLDTFEDAEDSYSVALLSMVCKHNMTDSCTADMLKLFAQMLPAPNPLPPSLFLLFNKFVLYDQETLLYRCCGFCSTLLSTDMSCQSTECLAACVQDSSFIEIRLDKQLQTLFSGTHHAYIINMYLHVYTVDHM